MDDNCSVCALDGMLYNLTERDGKTFCDECLPEPTVCRKCKIDFGDPGELNIQEYCGRCAGKDKAYTDILFKIRNHSTLDDLRRHCEEQIEC